MGGWSAQFPVLLAMEPRNISKGEIFLGTDQGMMAVQGLNLSALFMQENCVLPNLWRMRPAGFCRQRIMLDEDISIARKLSRSGAM